MNEAQFTTTGARLVVERSFDAPIFLVWKAWTTADLLDQWWAPKPYQSQTKHMTFVEGGYRLYVMVGPNGEEHWGRTNYTKIVKEQEFAGEDVFCDENGAVNEELPVAVFVNTFKVIGEGRTQVIMTTTYASEEALDQVLKMGLEQGLKMTLQNLDEVLAAQQ